MDPKLNNRMDRLEKELETMIQMQIDQHIEEPMMMQSTIRSSIISPDYMPKDPTVYIQPGLAFSSNFVRHQPQNYSRQQGARKTIGDCAKRQEVHLLFKPPRNSPRNKSKNSSFSSVNYVPDKPKIMEIDLSNSISKENFESNAFQEQTSKSRSEILFIKIPNSNFPKSIETSDASVQIGHRDDVVIVEKDNFVTKVQLDAEIKKREDSETVAKNMQDEMIKLRCDAEELNKTKAAFELEVRKREEAERTAKNLRTEVEKIRNEIAQLTKIKNESCETSKKFKDRYENLRSSRKDLMTKMESLQKENAKLGQDIEDEIKIRKITVDNAVAKTIKDMKAKIEKASKEDNDTIINEAMKRLKERERSLDEREKVAEESVQKLQDDLKRLTETNEQFALKLKSNSEERRFERNEFEQLKCQLNSCKTTASKYEQEVEALNKKLKNLESEEIHVSRENRRLGDQLKESKDCERECRKQVASLAKELRNIEALRVKQLDTCGAELQQLNVEHRNLLKEHDHLQQTLRDTEDKDKKRSDLLEMELAKFTEAITKKEKITLQEKNELTRMVEDLTEIVQKQKNRINELKNACQENELVLNSHAADMKIRDDQIYVQVMEIEEFKKKYKQLEEQVTYWQTSYNAVDMQLKKEMLESKNRQTSLSSSTIAKLKEKVADLSETVDVERDRVLLKEKVILDQLKTMEDLKERIKKLYEEMSNKDFTIAESKRDKENLLKDIETIERKKRQLEDQIEELEESLQEASKQQMKIGKQHTMLKSLEQQVTEQRKRWNQEREMMTKEKAQAVKVAKFATHKLLETVSDFQRQVEFLKKGHAMVTQLLANKEQQLSEANRRIYLMNSELEEISVSEEIMREHVQKKIRSARETCSEIIEQVFNEQQLNSDSSNISNKSSMFERPKPFVL